MWLEQAVYTSTKTRQGEGYHVVAKSPGVSNDITVALNRWCPSHASLQGSNTDFESLNFHRLTDQTLAISRTVYGGKEFSNRGGLQVATMVLVLKPPQLAGYGNNPLRLARTARALGHLRWQPQFPAKLDRVDLPPSEVAQSLIIPAECFPNIATAVGELRDGKRVAIVAGGRAEEISDLIIRRLPADQPLSFGFTTGLKWSKQRPFQFCVLRSVDSKTRLLLNIAKVTIIDAESLEVCSPNLR